MSLLACGLNHKTAPLAIRERVVFSQENISERLMELTRDYSIEEAAILSTCNRTEIYCHAESESKLIPWLAQKNNLTIHELSPYIYIHQDRDAVKHMMRVACGLDSMALGEPQILGQLKTAYMKALEMGAVGSQLAQVFQRVFRTTKRIRTQTTIGHSAISIAYAAVTLAKKIFTDLSKLHVLLIGAGETIELAARHLKQNGVKNFSIANRSAEHAAKLVQRFSAKGLGIGEIPYSLKEADIVITATACPMPFIGVGTVERAMQERNQTPMYLLDLAVPRDIEPEVGKLDQVHLYNIDDLKSIVKEGIADRRVAAIDAEQMIEHELDNYVRMQQASHVNHTIRDYREKVVEVSNQELARAMQALKKGIAPEAVLFEMNHRMRNKFLHNTSVRLRKAAYQGENDILFAARQLLDIDK